MPETEVGAHSVRSASFCFLSLVQTPGMAAFLFLTLFPQMLIIIYMHSVRTLLL
jgi:hypothetical protein